MENVENALWVVVGVGVLIMVVGLVVQRRGKKK